MWTEQFKIKEETLTPWWMEEAPMLFGNGGEIQYAQNGAKLEDIETSEDPNVIPEGAMHKNKNHLDLDITPKGIPVGHLTTGEEVSNIEDIQTAKGDFVQDAEIESSEVIFSKELTDYVENARKEWRNSYKQNNELLLEVGKRITKELLTNTEDNVDLIPQMEKQLQ